ncbi:uncharacterized protein C2845_PM05G22990 [Panicum miliaceum]|uniref:F-box domain-containing protein n=1 Tax=Panicum miliaceum TaxID=4540 RepID=A0A3L6SYT4_PANMI|nr:uncharacterized protein C2845_PM05G22990 [Panicum miliaceum]
MASVSLPDNINDDVLREILLRLPPLPSSLPRASLVCKSWCRLVSDPGFLRRFREHHRTPPLLGYFFSDRGGPIFTPTLAPPNCIPPERFSLPEHPAGERLFFLGCRHGLALLINRRRLQATVWDPVTNRKVTVAYPPEFTTDNGAHCFRGAVLSSAGGDGGYDGHSRPFKVILISTHINDGHTSVFMCVYESGTGKWGNTISTIIPSYLFNLPNVLVGNAVLCGFFLWPDGILELDLDRHTLGIIQTPTSSLHPIDSSFFRVVQTQDRGLGLAILSRLSIQLWGRKADPGGVAGWVLQITVEVDRLLSLPPSMMANVPARILGYDEDSNAIHLATSTGVYAVQLESMQFTELFNVYRISGHPYTSFYTEGWGICAGDNRKEILNSA